MIDPLEGKLEAIAALCREYGVLRLDVFGSAAKGTFDPEASDLDFVYTYALQGSGSRAHRYFDFVERLEALFDRKVDLVCDWAVKNPYFREELEMTRRNVYLAPGETVAHAVFNTESPAATKSRRLKQHLYDALAASQRIAKYTDGMTFDGFIESELCQAATTRQLCLLGRALDQFNQLQSGILDDDATLRDVMELGMRIGDDYRAVNHREIWERAATQADELQRRTAALLNAA